MSATDRAWKASVPTQLLPGQKGSRKPGVHRRISRQSCGKVTFMEQKGRPHTGKKTGIQLSCSSPHRYIPEDREIMGIYLENRVPGVGTFELGTW